MFGTTLIIFMGCSANTLSADERMKLYTRASLDFRGHRPTISELQAITDSDKALHEGIDTIIDSPRFGYHYGQLMAGVWKTEVVEYDHTDHEYALANQTDILGLLTSLGQEPLQVLSEIAQNDIPYSAIVTSDWTMSDSLLSEWSPVSYDWNNPQEWQRVTYTDDRPHAGILVSNGLWWRYNSTLSNAGRGRANVVSKLLLCNDFLERRIAVDRSLSLLDEGSVKDAIETNPTCVGCHVDLDPLASNFWGLYRHFRFSLEEQFSYHPERELHWIEQTGTAPGYYGSPTTSLSDLGSMMAQDPALYTCIVRRTMAQMTQQPVNEADIDAWRPHLHKFIEAGYTIKPLVRSIMNDLRYQNVNTKKIVSPTLYMSQVEYATGYAFTVDDVRGFETDIFGLRGLFGGRGKDWLTNPSSTPTTTFSLVVQRLAEAAAYHAVYTSQPKTLFSFDISTGDSGQRSMLRTVFVTILSREPSADELSDLFSLWHTVYDLNHDPLEAWFGTLTFLFRHPDFLTY